MNPADIITSLSAELESDRKSLCDCLTKQTLLARSLGAQSKNPELQELAKQIRILHLAIANAEIIIDQRKKLSSVNEETMSHTQNQGETKIYPAPKDLPMFEITRNRNEPLDVIRFLEVYESRMEAHGIPQSHWSRMFSCCVPGSDLATLQWIRKNISKLPWHKAQEELVSHYQVPDVEDLPLYKPQCHTPIVHTWNHVLIYLIIKGYAFTKAAPHFYTSSQ